MESKTVLLLAMHGMPPKDFPKRELSEWGRLRASFGSLEGADRARFQELERKLRAWPRTPENDLFHASSHDLAWHLETQTGLKVIVGFNEFCSPSLEEAFDLAARQGAQKILVVTPMMIR